MENRITPYEAGWLSMLVEQRLCSQEDARAAMNRLAQAAIDEIVRLKRARKRRKNP